MLDTEPFSKTFGKKATRKKPNLKAPDLGKFLNRKIFKGEFSFFKFSFS